MYLQDTITAISTPCGEGGIGVIRISGPLSLQILTTIFVRSGDGDFLSHRFYYGQILDPEAELFIDEALAVYMRSPRSFTREDVVEIQCHSGTVIMQQILALVLRYGARLADPGEFTKRAFLNGRIDLLQAESIIDLIRAKTDTAASVANAARTGALSERISSAQTDLRNALALVEAYIDFPDEELPAADSSALFNLISSANSNLSSLLTTFSEGRALREGVSVMIAGKPNVGKSSLLNALLQEKRAIVTSIPGTTRDFIEEIINIQGLPFRLLDTAGIRDTTDPVESEGVRLAVGRIDSADLIIYLLDGSREFDADDYLVYDALKGSHYIQVINKCDLPQALVIPDFLASGTSVTISTHDTASIDNLKSIIAQNFLQGKVSDSREAVFLTRARHHDLLCSVTAILTSMLKIDSALIPHELLAVDLRESLHLLGQVSGATTPDDILDLIFNQFCIGK
jgi:tRNA modification GTPase